jgi:tRNA threonylcarbamoyladenosine modification (KEOPS) complex  Pcc1 subunit
VIFLPKKTSKKQFPFHSTLELTTANTKEIIAVFKAINPETTVEVSPRSQVTAQLKNENTLIVRFEADDFISLRASVSSFLRWIEAATKTINILEQ